MVMSKVQFKCTDVGTLYKVDEKLKSQQYDVTSPFLFARLM